MIKDSTIYYELIFLPFGVFAIIFILLSAFWSLCRKIAHKRHKPTHKINKDFSTLWNIFFYSYIVISSSCLLYMLYLVFLKNASTSITTKTIEAILNTLLSLTTLRIARIALNWLITRRTIAMILENVREGDRIRVSNGKDTYVGDVINISWSHLTLFEDVTLDTCLKNNGRAGRFISVPKHHINTNLFINYNHLSYLGINMVWDSVDFLIDFKSNLRAARDIAEEIATAHSKDYVEKMRKQLDKKREYLMFDSQNNIERMAPRIFIMPDKGGMRLYAFYIADPRETLELRSEISIAIVEAFNTSDDILILDGAKKES